MPLHAAPAAPYAPYPAQRPYALYPAQKEGSEVRSQLTSIDHSLYGSYIYRLTHLPEAVGLLVHPGHLRLVKVEHVGERAAKSHTMPHDPERH